MDCQCQQLASAPRGVGTDAAQLWLSLPRAFSIYLYHLLRFKQCYKVDKAEVSHCKSQPPYICAGQWHQWLIFASRSVHIGKEKDLHLWFFWICPVCYQEVAARPPIVAFSRPCAVGFIISNSSLENLTSFLWSPQPHSIYISRVWPWQWHHFPSHLGLISIDEFRQTWKLFNLHLKNNIDDKAIDNLARSIDVNQDGSIDFNEFLEAFHVVHKFEKR